ncbi:hypothetical protein OP10G_0064 [Fimbriimonas ginsengisoli Gsoil 348]|uniref:Uncharacterized protein n=2 Tax=Fimbriimonas ginsengisoli TaxID=1005039 RepID=A0A068NIY7_FIMGI|nr:hypothetical protein OP10G_0064 [Fimbriimonas ginsengisoli Gsoil 348]
MEWAQDARCQVSLRELRSRLEREWEPEAAITTASASRASRARNLLAAFGEEKSLSEWSRDDRCVVSSLTIAARVQRGWNPEEAITTPVHGRIRPRRPSTPRPPSARRPRALVNMEPPSDLDADAVREKMREGAELWFAGSSGDRVSLVEREATTIIAPEVLQQLQDAGELLVVYKTGSVVQYGLAPAASSA